VLIDPKPEDLDRLAKQWLVADDYVQRCCDGARLSQTTEDLALIQHVINSRAIQPTERYELQCLGVALGRVLARNVGGLDWAIVEDEYGRDPTLRYRQTSLQVNVLTMISKRIERGDSVDIQEMYSGLARHVDELKSKVD